MSTRRILVVMIFGILFIAALVGVMLLTSYLRRDYDPVPLPEISAPAVAPGNNAPDMLSSIKVTRENIQEVVSTLSRPESYSRDITIESFWEGGQAGYSINASVAGGFTSLRTVSSTGIEKRILITPDTIYIWYRGDRTPYIGNAGTAGDDLKDADEYQMLVTYEDVLDLDKNYILDAGYTRFGDEECVYAEYREPWLGYIMKYYVSIDLGLIVGAEEYDVTGALVYRMSAGECAFEIDAAAFTLPDGTELLTLETTG